MKWFKRFIARLFNIHPEDLPEFDRSSVTKTPPTFIDTTREGPEDYRELTYLDQKHVDDEKLQPIDDEEFPLIDEEATTQLTSEEIEAKYLPDTVLTAPTAALGKMESEEIETAQDEQGPLFTEEEIIPPEEAKPEQPLEEIKPRLTPIHEKTLRLGIDFGTTTTAVSLKIDDELPEALPIGLDGVTRYIPSVVYFQPGEGDLDMRVVVGEDTEGFVNQPYVVHSVKRCLGCSGKGCHEDGRRKNRFSWCRGDGKIQISKSECLEPERIAFYIVREALQRAIAVVRERWQLDLTQENVILLPVNLGCSAKFNINQRKIIRSVSKNLGFSQVQIGNVVEEPILAGFTFARFAENPEGRILIYDFGGGTFDVAILEVDRIAQGLRVTVLTTAGDNWLGGDDIDSMIYNHFLEHVGKDISLSTDQVEDQLDSIEQSRLLRLARQAKEQLSSVEVYREVLMSGKLGPIDVELTRSEFEQLMNESGLVDKSLTAVKLACQLAFAFENARKGMLLDYPAIIKHDLKDAASMIDQVILVGGVTKIPYVRQQLEMIFPEKIVSETVIEPISAVAIGGAYPRDPQHYSLTAPPFGFFLEAVEVNTGKEVKKPIFEPYEYLDFHHTWLHNARPAHIHLLDLKSDLKMVKLCYTLAGESKSHIHQELGSLHAGNLKFCVTLDGEMFCEMAGERPRTLKPYPIIHPVQEEIKKAKEQRAKPLDDGSTYDDWMRDMMSEN